MRNNLLSENTTGIFVIVLPNLPTSSTETALIEGNVVHKNNRPNPFPPVCQTAGVPPGCVEEFFDDLQLLPSGSGILNVGGHDVSISGNVVVNNDTAGVGVVENPFGFGSSNHTVVTRNVIVQNLHLAPTARRRRLHLAVESAAVSVHLEDRARAGDG